EAKLALVIAEEHARLGAGIVEGGDKQGRPTAAVDVAPGRSVAADTRQLRKEAGLVANVTEGESGPAFRSLSRSLPNSDQGEQQGRSDSYPACVRRLLHGSPLCSF